MLCKLIKHTTLLNTMNRYSSPPTSLAGALRTIKLREVAKKLEDSKSNHQ